MKAEFDEDPGIYSFTHEFVKFTNAAIHRGDFAVVKKCYDLIDRLFKNADGEVFNVISVSYIEHLEVHPSHGENGIRAKRLMTAAMLAQWKKLEAYWMGMSKVSKPKTKSPKSKRG